MKNDVLKQIRDITFAPPSGCAGCIYEPGKEVMNRCRECSRWPLRSDLYLPNDLKAVVVHFVLIRQWHAVMLAGRKDIEYRAVTPYWKVRLTRRHVTHATFSCGYKTKGRFIRPVTHIDIGPCPYKGWTGDFYRIHLGPIMHPNDERQG